METAMGLEKWILSDSRYAQMRDVRRVDEMGSVRSKWAAKRSRDAATRTARLEADVGYLALVLGGVLELLDKKGAVTKADLKKKMKELDGVDGVRDGKFDLDVLRRFGESDDATR
jgi:hypothetical protein